MSTYTPVNTVENLHVDAASSRFAYRRVGPREAAAMGQVRAITASLSTPWKQVVANLRTVTQPMLSAKNMHDVMIHAFASYAALEHIPAAKLVLYSDAGHAFRFQHLKDFRAETKSFLAN